MRIQNEERVVRAGHDVLIFMAENVPNTIALYVSGWGALAISPKVHRQIAHRLMIPWRYYERMLKHAPALLASTISEWWRQMPEDRLLRVGSLNGSRNRWALEWLMPPGVLSKGVARRTLDAGIDNEGEL
jgi:hypothetical protein